GAAALVLGGNHDVYGLVAIAGLVAIGQAFALEIDHGTISAGVVAALAGSAMFGVRAALPLAAVSAAVDVVARRWPPAQGLLTLGARSLALLVAAGIFALGFHGTVGELVTVAVGAVAGAGSFVVLSAILSLALVLEGREAWWPLWRERFRWLGPH